MPRPKRKPYDPLGQFRGLSPAGEHSHPFVRKLFDEARRQRVSLSDLAMRSGVNRETIGAWRTRNSPTLQNLQAVAMVLGMRVRLTKAKEDDDVVE